MRAAPTVSLGGISGAPRTRRGTMETVARAAAEGVRKWRRVIRCRCFFIGSLVRRHRNDSYSRPCSIRCAGWCGVVEVGSWRLEVGGWRLEVGGWKLEVGSWKFPLQFFRCSRPTRRPIQSPCFPLPPVAILHQQPTKHPALQLELRAPETERKNEYPRIGSGDGPERPRDLALRGDAGGETAPAPRYAPGRFRQGCPAPFRRTLPRMPRTETFRSGLSS